MRVCETNLEAECESTGNAVDVQGWFRVMVFVCCHVPKGLIRARVYDFLLYVFTPFSSFLLS